MGKDQFGSGKSRRIPANKIKKSQQGGSHKKGCCSMVEAGRSLRRGKFRLASRYAVLSVKLIARRVTTA